MKLETKAAFFLVLATAFWGLTFPLIENAMQFISPTSFVFLRMILASLIFLPFVLKKMLHSNKLILFGGCILALLNGMTHIFQTEGLQTIPASRSAFITGFAVVLVPLLSPIFKLGKPKKIEILAVMSCLLGLYILTGTSFHSIEIGDMWSLGCAITYALGVLSLQVIAKHTSENLLLSFYTTLFGIVVPLGFISKLNIAEINHWQVLLALLFCACIATAFVTYLTTRYQKHIRVARVAVIYALEPVFATLFAVMFFHQSINLITLIGGMLIFISIVLPVIYGKFMKSF